MAAPSDTADRARDPFSPGLQRFTALAGIGFAVLMIATIALSGDDIPDFEAPASEWTAYAEDNQDAQRLSLLVFVFAAYAFIIFLGWLRSELGRAEDAARGFTRAGYFVLAGGIVGITGMTIGIGISATSTIYEDAPPEIIRAVNLAGNAGFILAAPGFAAMLITTFLAGSATKALPSWLNILALVAGVSFLLQPLTLLNEEGDNVFGIFYPIGFLALAIFAIGSSLQFLKRVE